MADTATTATHTVTLDGIGPVPVTVTERGAGRPFLLLHGGAGPQSVDGFAALLASSWPARVLTPLHPGFGGTPRPDGLTTIRGLGRLYVQLIEDLGLTGVTVVGNSIGGWIAAEIALLDSPRISHVVLVDAAGLRLDAYPVPDFFSLSLDRASSGSAWTPSRTSRRRSSPLTGPRWPCTAGTRWTTPPCSDACPRPPSRCSWSGAPPTG